MILSTTPSCFLHPQYEERDSKLRDAEKAKLSLEECSHNAWLLRDQRYFGKKGSDYDFGGKDRDQKSAEVQELDRENKILERKVNKKCIAQYEQCAAVYEENKGKVEKLRNDKVKIQELIAQIDVTKSKMLAVTHTKVNAHFNTIFSQLLKGATCGLYKLDGCQRVEEGLQIQVCGELLLHFYMCLHVCGSVAPLMCLHVCGSVGRVECWACRSPRHTSSQKPSLPL